MPDKYNDYDRLSAAVQERIRLERVEDIEPRTGNKDFSFFFFECTLEDTLAAKNSGVFS